MNLAIKKKINHNGIDYLIDVNKIFYSNISGEDYYIYDIFIYDIDIKRNTGLKKIFFKKYECNCIYKYKTYWLNYLKYNGDIEKVINEAFDKYEWNRREQKYILHKELEWCSK